MGLEGKSAGSWTGANLQFQIERLYSTLISQRSHSEWLTQRIVMTTSIKAPGRPMDEWPWPLKVVIGVAVSITGFTIFYYTAGHLGTWCRKNRRRPHRDIEINPASGANKTP